MKNEGALADGAYRQIRRMILTRELESGVRLSQRGLAKQLGVSAMPIIEALRRLEQEGLVERHHELGAFVKEWTTPEIVETFVIRRGLEVEAARAMAVNASEDEIKTLFALSELIDDAIRRSDNGALIERELAFHLHIARCAHMPRLYEALETTHALIRSMYQWQGRAEELKHVIGQHSQLAEVIASGKPARAANLMFEHITIALDLLRDQRKNGPRSHAEARTAAPDHDHPPGDDGVTLAIGSARELLV